jgi:hypothetical protein
VTPLFFDIRPGVAKIKAKIAAPSLRPQSLFNHYSSTAGVESTTNSGGTVSGSCNVAG